MGEKSYPHREFRMTFQEREAETACAMEILGCEWQQWEIPDNAPLPNALRTWLRAYESEDSLWKPDQVFAPSVDTDDGNHQHNLVGEVAADVFGEKVTFYTTYTKGGRDRRGEEVPYEPDWPALKLRALACYETQIRHPSTRSHFIEGGLQEYVLP